jgi:hypothetical protein
MGYNRTLLIHLNEMLDKKERDRAVKSLRKYLTHRQKTEEVELLKLWKGIFYCKRLLLWLIIDIHLNYYHYY